MFFASMLCAGILFTSLLGWLNWRVISGILAVFPLILLAAMCMAPESPYYLMKKGIFHYKFKVDLQSIDSIG